MHTLSCALKKNAHLMWWLNKLESWGIKIHRGLGKTGVVGIIEGSLGKGRSIGLRADMDALPLQEHNHF